MSFILFIKQQNNSQCSVYLGLEEFDIHLVKYHHMLPFTVVVTEAEFGYDGTL